MAGSTTRAQIKDETLITVIPLRDAAKEFLRMCKGANKAPNTITAYKGALGRLCGRDDTGEDGVCPPGMPAYQLTQFYVTEALRIASRPESDREFGRRFAANSSASRRTGRENWSLDIDRGCYRSFEKFLKGEHYLSANTSPTYGLKNSPKRVNRARREKGRWILPYERWAELLNELEDLHPRARAEAAMMLYGGRRFSDIKSMRIGDIDLDREEFSFLNIKAGGVPVTLPIIWPEFLTEIRRWLAWLASQFGELDPDWYLFPARLHTSEFRWAPPRTDMYPGWPVDPEIPVDYQAVRVDIRRGMELVGAPISTMTIGPHALRHACARHLTDDEGWSDEDVSIYLDHDDVKTTRTYTEGSGRAKRLLNKYGDGPIPTDDRPSPKRAAGVKARRALEKALEAEELEELELAA